MSPKFCKEGVRIEKCVHFCVRISLGLPPAMKQNLGKHSTVSWVCTYCVIWDQSLRKKPVLLRETRDISWLISFPLLSDLAKLESCSYLPFRDRRQYHSLIVIPISIQWSLQLASSSLDMALINTKEHRVLDHFLCSDPVCSMHWIGQTSAQFKSFC